MALICCLVPTLIMLDRNAIFTFRSQVEPLLRVTITPFPLMGFRTQFPFVLEFCASFWREN